MSSETSSSAFYTRAGWFVWLTLAAVISSTVILSILTGQERSVTPAYCSAVENWFSGKPLYNMSGHGFIYLPQAALTFAPWAILPHAACELVWRWTIIAVFAYSVKRLNDLLAGDGRWFCVMSFSSAVLAWGCARNGQSTLLMTGLMILAASDLSEKRWWRASLLLALAFAFKPLAFVLIMLAAVIYPQTSWRLAIGLGIVVIAPFLTQRPDYVMTQYFDSIESLKITFEVGESEKWAQFFGMLQVARIDLPAPVRTAIRLLASAGTLVLCWSAARRLSPQRACYYLFSLTACYLMLFNSRTEGNTYAMVGPVYGALLAEAAFRLKNRSAAGWMIAAVVLSVANYELAILVSPRPDAIWISPLTCVGVSGYLVTRLIQDRQTASRVALETNSTTDVLPRPVNLGAAA